ncbi:MAG: hypothetical protein WCS31_11990 [Verrucomicrobiae bacterium]
MVKDGAIVYAMPKRFYGRLLERMRDFAGGIFVWRSLLLQQTAAGSRGEEEGETIRQGISCLAGS